MDGKIYIVGPIGSMVNPDGSVTKGVELIDVIAQVKNQPKAVSFTVHIDSPGGVVEVGEAIFKYLQSIKKPITTVGSNMVASIATVIFMAGATRIVNENCEFMIHLPMGGIEYATADELAEYSKQVRTIENRMVKFYAKVTGLEEEAIRPLLKNETWLTPEQLKTFGFITADTPLKITAKAYITKPDNKKKMKDKKKSDKKKNKGLKGFMKMIEDALKNQVVNLILLTADQVEVDFFELSEGDEISEGAKARIDGSNADGTYTMADGRIVTFSDGAVTDIQEPEAEEALEEANAEIAKLKKANKKLASKNQQLTTANAKAMKSIKKIKKLKSQFVAGEEGGKQKQSNKGKGKGKKSAFSSAMAGIKKGDKKDV